MSNAVPPLNESSGTPWKCPSCQRDVHGNVKPHFPIRSGDMQMRHKCPGCGHRFFRSATEDELNSAFDNAQATSRTWRRLAANLRSRSDMHSMKRLHGRLERASENSVSAHAYLLLLQSVAEKSLARIDVGAHMVPTEIVVDLLLDMRDLVTGTPAQPTLETLLAKAQTNPGYQILKGELNMSLDQIKRESVQHFI